MNKYLGRDEIEKKESVIGNIENIKLKDMKNQLIKYKFNGSRKVIYVVVYSEF